MGNEPPPGSGKPCSVVRRTNKRKIPRAGAYIYDGGFGD